MAKMLFFVHHGSHFFIYLLFSMKFSPFDTSYQSFTYMWCDLGQSVRSRTCDVFSFLFDWSPHQERYILLKTPPEPDQWFQSYSNWKILKTIENKRNAFLFLSVSQNQCSRLPTEPARSQHILRILCAMYLLTFCACHVLVMLTYSRYT